MVWTLAFICITAGGLPCSVATRESHSVQAQGEAATVVAVSKEEEVSTAAAAASVLANVGAGLVSGAPGDTSASYVEQLLSRGGGFSTGSHKQCCRAKASGKYKLKPNCSEHKGVISRLIPAFAKPKEVAPGMCCEDPTHVCCTDPGHECCKDPTGLCCLEPEHVCCRDPTNICCQNPRHECCKDPTPLCCREPKNVCCRDPTNICCTNPLDLCCIAPKHECCKNPGGLCCEHPDHMCCINPKHVCCTDPSGLCCKQPKHICCNQPNHICCRSPNHVCCTDPTDPCCTEHNNRCCLVPKEERLTCMAYHLAGSIGMGRTAQSQLGLLRSFLRVQNREMRDPSPLVEIRGASRVFVIGDVHGQLDQLLAVMQKIMRILSRKGQHKPGGLVCEAGLYYVFLGDYVDRGEKDVETAALVLAFRALCPHDGKGGVVLLRGNHEDTKINEAYGLNAHLERLERGGGLLQLMGMAWATLPVAATLDEKVLLTHGGLAKSLSEDYAGNFAAFAAAFRAFPAVGSFCEKKMVLCDMMWSDPLTTGDGWDDSPRGAGDLFGVDAMRSFTKSTGIELIIRGHQAEMNGYASFFGNDLSVLTVFTAADYSSMRNNGAFAELHGSALLRPVLHIHDGTFQHTYILRPDDTKISSVLETQAAGTVATPSVAPQRVGLQPDAACSARFDGLRDEVEDEVANVLRSTREGGGGIAARTMQARLRADEVGEAGPLRGHPGEHTRLACKRSSVGQAVALRLAALGAEAAAPEDAATVRKESAGRSSRPDEADSEAMSRADRGNFEPN